MGSVEPAELLSSPSRLTPAMADESWKATPRCPLAPPAAPEAPRRGGAPGRHRGAARASGAFPQLPWTAPTRGGWPRPPAVRKISSPGQSTPLGSSQAPRPAGARSCRGGWRGAAGKGGACCGSEGRYNDGIERSAARLTSRRSLPRRKRTLCCSSGGASRARAPASFRWWLAPAPAPPGATPPSSSASLLVRGSVRAAHH